MAKKDMKAEGKLKPKALAKYQDILLEYQSIYEEMPKSSETAKLLEVVYGEDVEKMDTLLSLAITGGDYTWI